MGKGGRKERSGVRRRGLGNGSLRQYVLCSAGRGAGWGPCRRTRSSFPKSFIVHLLNEVILVHSRQPRKDKHAKEKKSPVSPQFRAACCAHPDCNLPDFFLNAEL